MSDGPHRSLSMSRAYKKVAERAYNENFDVQEFVTLFTRALVDDLRKDVPTEAVELLRGQFRAGEMELFPDQRAHDLSAARRLVDGSPLGALLVDCTAEGLSYGNVGEQGLVSAVDTALLDRAARAARQIEEHYYRHPDASETRTVQMRERLDHAIAQLDTANMARQALGDRSATLDRIARHEGLDEGVPFP